MRSVLGTCPVRARAYWLSLAVEDGMSSYGNRDKASSRASSIKAPSRSARPWCSRNPEGVARSRTVCGRGVGRQCRWDAAAMGEVERRGDEMVGLAHCFVQPAPRNGLKLPSEPCNWPATADHFIYPRKIPDRPGRLLRFCNMRTPCIPSTTKKGFLQCGVVRHVKGHSLWHARINHITIPRLSGLAWPVVVLGHHTRSETDIRIFVGTLTRQRKKSSGTDPWLLLSQAQQLAMTEVYRPPVLDLRDMPLI